MHFCCICDKSCTFIVKRDTCLKSWSLSSSVGSLSFTDASWLNSFIRKALRGKLPSFHRWQRQDISNTLFSYHLPKRPKVSQAEWIRRETGDTMPTCPPFISLFRQLHCDIPSFPPFSLFSSPKSSSSYRFAFTQADGLDEFLWFRLEIKPKSSVFLCV